MTTSRGGKIRVLCSQVLSSDDIEALEKGYSARVDEVLAARLVYDRPLSNRKARSRTAGRCSNFSTIFRHFEHVTVSRS